MITAGSTITGGSNKWYKVTSNPTLTFTSGGTVAIKVTNGVSYKDGSAVTVGEIDRTEPTAASFTTTQTTNSITVTASGTDEQSGIVRYQFSKDGGSNWTTAQTSNKYIFSSLSSGSYNIKVRVINGTFVNNGQNSLNTKESDTKAVTLVCNNTTKTVSCSKTCGTGSVSGTRVDTYNCNNQLVSTGTCNATCPAAPKVTNFTVTAGTIDESYNTTSVTLAVTVTSGANISKYEFYNGNTLIATSTTTSKSTSKVINNLSTSAMNFRVVVYDQYGQTGSSNITESCSLSSQVNPNVCYNGIKYQVYNCTSPDRQYSRLYSFINTCTNTTTTKTTKPSFCNNVGVSDYCSTPCSSGASGASGASACCSCYTNYRVSCGGNPVWIQSAGKYC